MLNEAKLRSQFIQLFKCCLCNVQSVVAAEKNGVLSVDQSQLQALQFLVHLTNLLSIFCRYNGFTGIQKAGEDEIICVYIGLQGKIYFLLRVPVKKVN